MKLTSRVAICAYLFDMFCIEGKKLSVEELADLQKVIGLHSPGADPLAETLTSYLRRLKK